MENHLTPKKFSCFIIFKVGTELMTTLCLNLYLKVTQRCLEIADQSVYTVQYTYIFIYYNFLLQEVITATVQCTLHSITPLIKNYISMVEGGQMRLFDTERAREHLFRLIPH